MRFAIHLKHHHSPGHPALPGGWWVQNTVNGVVTKYTLHGKNVVHMTQGGNDLHFFYDAANKPAVVVYNGTAYAYVKNLQGDIIAILDQSGNAVVQYAYDAWGAPTSLTGSMASTLGVINPFRYRGYVYDQETGLYYLRSRYYNPTWCRFVNADSTCGVISRIFAHAVFAYCNNAPTMRMDHEGNESLSVSQSNSDTLEPAIRSLINAIYGAEHCSSPGEFSIISITYCNEITPEEAEAREDCVEGIADAIAFGIGSIFGVAIGSGSWLMRVSESTLGGIIIDKTTGYVQDFFVDMYKVRPGIYDSITCQYIRKYRILFFFEVADIYTYELRLYPDYCEVWYGYLCGSCPSLSFPMEKIGERTIVGVWEALGGN